MTWLEALGVSPTECALVVTLLGDEWGDNAVAILVDAIGAPLFHHAQEPDIKPVCPTCIVGWNGAC